MGPVSVSELKEALSIETCGPLTPHLDKRSSLVKPNVKDVYRLTAEGLEIIDLVDPAGESERPPSAG